MKIAIIGYGKMGKAIEKVALSKKQEVFLRVNRENIHELKSKIQAADVAIEFSRPESAFENISACLEMGVPVVSGTTGWLDKMDTVKSLCNKHKGAFLYASNFSIGVNVFFALNKYLSTLMKKAKQYDVSIEEIHHVHKLDFPSGTAITLAEGILANSQQKDSWEGYLENPSDAQTKTPSPEKLLITSKRIDAVPGTHFVRWSSDVDQLEICLLYTSPSPRDRTRSRMPSSA